MYVHDIIGWYLIYIYLNHTEAYIFPSFVYSCSCRRLSALKKKQRSRRWQMATGGSCEAFKSFCIGRLGGMVPARRRNGDLNLSRWSLTWWVKLINWLIRFRTFFGILESLGFGKCVFYFPNGVIFRCLFYFLFSGLLGSIIWHPKTHPCVFGLYPTSPLGLPVAWKISFQAPDCVWRPLTTLRRLWMLYWRRRSFTWWTSFQIVKYQAACT